MSSIPILSCEKVHLLPNAQQCEFVHNQCQDYPGFINSFTVYYCIAKSDTARHWIGIPLLILLLVVLFGSIGLVAGNCLVPNLNAITSYLKIPENVSGITLLAFANGSPDIISTYTSFKTGNTTLAFGEIIGAAFFINTVVIGVIFIIKPFDLLPFNKQNSQIMSSDDRTEEEKLIDLNAKSTYLRDVFFFTAASILLLYCIRDGVLTRFEMWLLVSLYFTYVTLIIAWQWYFDNKIAKSKIDSHARTLYDENPASNNFIMLLSHSNPDDSYNYNPRLIRNIEFTSILANITNKPQVGIYRDTLGNTYRDSEDSNPDSIEIGDIHAELIEPRQKSHFEIILEIFTLPFLKLFTHTIPIMTEADYNGEYKPSLPKLVELLVSLLLSPFIIYATFFPDISLIWKILSIIPTIGFTYLTYQNLILSSNPSILIKCGISVLGVMCSISWISIIASEVISILTLLSSLTYIKPSAMGITVFALGNSVGDLISSIVISKMGYPLMALASCVGGPLLNILLGLGLNGLLMGYNEIEIPASVSLSLCLIGLLFNLVVILLIFIPLGGWRCDKYVGIWMIFLWFVGVTVSIIVEIILNY